MIVPILGQIKGDADEPSPEHYRFHGVQLSQDSLFLERKNHIVFVKQ